MQLTRRQMMAAVPAAGLLAAAAPALRAYAADPPDAGRILQNTLAMLAGTAASNARPEVASKLEAIQATARDHLAAMDAAGDGELFAGMPLGADDAALARSHQYLSEIALATRTAGVDTDLVENRTVQHRVIDALGWLHEHYLADQDAGYYGNWFNWEIGMPTHATRAQVLLADEIAAYRPDLTATVVATWDAYLRNGVDGDVDLDSRFHTGANLADITTNRILQGALLGDVGRITKAVEDQATVFETIDPYHLEHGVTDGYYADGSFIQHHSVAYTGSYGKTLLTRVVQTVAMVDGAADGVGSDLVDVVVGWVRHGFAPLIYEGWMMEAVKGRAVARTTSGYVDVRIVAEAVVDLADYARAADAHALRAYVKYLDRTSPTSLDPDGFVSPVSVARFADIVADPGLDAADLCPDELCAAYNAMDRTVHRRPGFAFSLARSSSRISKYEYMNGENLLPWFQGDGAHQLYLAGEDQRQAYGVDHYTTVAPDRLAGVTAPVEERRSVPDLYGELWYDNPDHPLEFTASSQSQNTYVYFPRATNSHSGGAVLGVYGAAGMVLSDDVPYVDKQAGVLPEDFVVYRNAAGTKSWFLLDEEIVVLAAGLDGRDGRGAVTTLDSRIAAPSEEVRVSGTWQDGTRWSGPGAGRLAWARYANLTRGTAVGYVVLDEQDVTVTLTDVTRSRRAVRLSNPDTAVTKNVFTLTVEHPAGTGPAGLAYAIVPHAREEQLAAYTSRPLSVLANTERMQAVRHDRLGLLAANVFADGAQQVANLRIDGPASVIARRRGRGLDVAISDPTMHRQAVTVLVRGRARAAETEVDGVTVRRVPGGTEVTAHVHQVYGASRTVTLV